MEIRTAERPRREVPPAYCQYADGPCDQSFDGVPMADTLFLYASQPAGIAAAIEEGAARLRRAGDQTVRTWRDLPIGGQVIFTEICKAMRFSGTVVADVTTLNFNLMFEIGFAIGLGLPVLPIRDTTYVKDEQTFKSIGVFDTLGYVDFTNGRGLAESLTTTLPARPLPPVPSKTFLDTPVYFLKGPIDTPGAVKLVSTLKKSRLRFRSYDVDETGRLSLGTARKQVHGSFGVVANLLTPNREGALVHNAICALVCGMAMAEQKVVLMLQEESVAQPIDYRDVVKSYDLSDAIPGLLEEPIHQIVEHMQEARVARLRPPAKFLERVDLGDPAAENEIVGLREYFVRTSQFRQAERGHARLVIGRKGSGKTAIFYEIRDAISAGHSVLALDLRPDGHQFTKLRETVLDLLTLGQQEHAMAGFWNYILLAEIAHKVLNKELKHAERDPDRFERYRRLEDAYLAHALASGDDLSQRLLRQVDRLGKRFGEAGEITARSDITELLYSGDIKALDDAVSDYLSEKDAVWLLLDNLDKSWATRGTTTEDILIVRGLLEATRKLQQQLERRGVDFNCLVFLRTDIYEHLLRDLPDRGKDTAIRLDWEDRAVFEDIIHRRIAASTGSNGEFADLWPAVSETHVGTEEAFGYLLDRTLMRPRDLLMFLQKAIEVALNRGNDRIQADDIRQAEIGYSEDMLLFTAYEIGDTHPTVADALYAFHGSDERLSPRAVEDVLLKAGISESDSSDATELLLWFGFLGVVDNKTDEERFAHDVRFNLRQLTSAVERGLALYIVHPAFRAALGFREESTPGLF